MIVGEVFNSLPGCDESGTQNRVMHLRRAGYGIATLKGGYYKVTFIPDNPIASSNTDKVLFFILDGKRHRLNDTACNTGLTRKQVLGAIRWLRNQTDIIIGGRGRDAWCQLYRGPA